MLNYDDFGNSSVLFHHSTRLNSTYVNKLFYNIYNPGVLGTYTNINLASVDDVGVYTFYENGCIVPTNFRVILQPGFGLFIRPNNINGIVGLDEPYASDFANLAVVDQTILDRQLIKCNVTKEIILTVPTDITYKYLCARLWWTNEKTCSVEFYFTNTWSVTSPQYILLIAELSYYGSPVLVDLLTTSQTTASLNSNILYEMNVDMLGGYHAGNIPIVTDVYTDPVPTIPISNTTLNENLNVEMVDGHKHSELAKLNVNNTNLNAEFIVDGNLKQYKAGNALGGIPISNTTVNQGLNAEKLNGQLVTEFADSLHPHQVHELTNGQYYKKLLGVNANNLATIDSFKDGAFRREKLAKGSFIAKNDDYGGQLKVVTGTLSTSWTDGQRKTIQFDAPFTESPSVMLQIKSSTGAFASNRLFKIQAVDISPTSFTIGFHNYLTAAANGYSGVFTAISTVVIDYCAVGYGYGAGQ